jgi:hypothetical protein
MTNWLKVGGFLKIIYTHLKIKNHQAKVVLDFIAWREQRRKDKKRKLFRYTTEEGKKMEEFYLQIRKLNYRGVPPATTKRVSS